MGASGWLQFALYFVALVLITKPMGLYLLQVLDANGRTWLDPVVRPLERVTYRLMGVDPNLYEAAAVDGANRWRRLWHVTLPGIIDVDVGPAVIDEAGIDHAAGAEQNFFGGDAAAPAVPTVPAHGRGEGDFFADDDFEFFVGGGEGVFGAEGDEEFAGVGEFAGD